MADLDPAAGAALLFGDLAPQFFVVGLVGRCIGRAYLAKEPVQIPLVAIIRVRLLPVDLLVRGVVEDFALAGRREDDELVTELAADRAGGRLHRHRLDAHALEGPEISEHLRVIREARARLVEVEAVGVLHQELAPAHHAEARPHLVAEFPLDMVEQFGQVAIALDRGADDLGHLLLVGRPVQHLAVVPVADAQHLLAVILIAPALAPQLGGLDGRH